jgi:hypothetical protein
VPGPCTRAWLLGAFAFGSQAVRFRELATRKKHGGRGSAPAHARLRTRARRLRVPRLEAALARAPTWKSCSRRWGRHSCLPGRQECLPHTSLTTLTPGVQHQSSRRLGVRSTGVRGKQGWRAQARAPAHAREERPPLRAADPSLVSTIPDHHLPSIRSGTPPRSAPRTNRSWKDYLIFPPASSLYLIQGGPQFSLSEQISEKS